MHLQQLLKRAARAEGCGEETGRSGAAAAGAGAATDAGAAAATGATGAGVAAGTGTGGARTAGEGNEADGKAAADELLQMARVTCKRAAAGLAHALLAPCYVAMAQSLPNSIGS